MIRAYRWNSTTCPGRDVPAAELPPAASALGDDVVWLDLENPTPDEEKFAFATFLPVHPLTLADVQKPRLEPDQGAHLSKAEEFADYLFVIVNPLPRLPADGKPTRLRLGKLARPQLSAVLTRTVLITHHYDPLACVDAARTHTAKHAACGDRGPDYLFHLILDAMVDEYADVVERVADRLDKIEARVFRKPDHAVLQSLLRLKRQVTFLRRTLVHEREVLARLTRGEFALVDAREIAYYRNVYDHLVRYTELIDTARESASDLMQSHLSATSNRLNEVMKVLTMISTVVLPMTLVAGIYGMNFDHMPELRWPLGYPLALGLMGAMAAAAFALFRWRRWL